MGNAGATNKTALIALAIVVVAIVGVAIFWLTHRSQPPQDCAFTGWKRTIGVDLDAQVQDLNAVKSKLGINDEMVRDYDTFMKDYALTYDSACQDVRAGRMSQGEYACLRQNMTRTLSDIRNFTQAVEAAKTLSDPSGQKAIIQKAYAALEQASRANYRLGCTSALNVNPKAISFTGDTLDSYVEITNAGNNDFTFSVDGLPASFRPHPPAGKLTVSGTAALVIERSYGPVPPTQPIKFLVRTNLNDEEEIAITVDSANRNVLERLGKKLRAAGATMEKALDLVNATASSRVSEADKHVLASTLLLSAGGSENAKVALAAATTQDSALETQPSTFFLKGVIAYREGEPETALAYFSKSKEASGSSYASGYFVPDGASISDLASGIINYNLGKREAADSFLKTNTLRKRVWENPFLLNFGAQEFCEKGGCQAYVDRTITLSPEGGG